jgi:hypothetical protein
MRQLSFPTIVLYKRITDKGKTALVGSTVGVRRRCSPPSSVAMTMVPAASAGAGERPSGGERGGAAGDVGGDEDEAALDARWAAQAAILWA